MTCASCGHEHAGAALAFICVGCPCPVRPSTERLSDEHGEILTRISLEIAALFRSAGLSPAERLLILGRHAGQAEGEAILLGHVTIPVDAMHAEIAARIAEERAFFLKIHADHVARTGA